MLGPHAGVEHRHHDLGAAAVAQPGGLDVDRRFHRAVVAAQVPLAHRRAAGLRQRVEPRAADVVRVVGRGEDALAAVGHGEFHVRVGRELRGQRLRADAGGAHHLGALAHRQPGLQRSAHAAAQAGGARSQRALHRGGIGARGQRVLAQHAGVGLELHDDLAGHRRQRRSRRAGGGGHGRGEVGQGQRGKQQQGKAGVFHARSLGCPPAAQGCAALRPRKRALARAAFRRVTIRSDRAPSDRAPSDEARSCGLRSVALRSLSAPSRAPSPAPCRSSPTRCRTRR